MLSLTLPQSPSYLQNAESFPRSGCPSLKGQRIKIIIKECELLINAEEIGLDTERLASESSPPNVDPSSG